MMTEQAKPRKRSPKNVEPQKVNRDDFVSEMLSVIASRCPEVRGSLPEIEAWARARFGGMKWYAASFRDRQELVQKIRQDFNGRNISELAKRYGVSRRTIYRYLTQGE